MDVAAVQGDIVERPDIVMNGKRDAAHDKHSHKEAERGEKQPFAPGMGEPLFVDGI